MFTIIKLELLLYNVIVIPFTDCMFVMPSVLMVEKVIFSLTYC